MNPSRARMMQVAVTPPMVGDGDTWSDFKYGRTFVDRDAEPLYRGSEPADQSGWLNPSAVRAPHLSVPLERGPPGWHPQFPAPVRHIAVDEVGSP